MSKWWEVEQLFHDKKIKEAQDAYNNNPNAKTCTDWGVAWMNSARSTKNTKKQASKEYNEAKKIFDHALELNEGDIEATWNIGLYYFYIVHVDDDITNLDYLPPKYYAEALKCFNYVKSKDSEFAKRPLSYLLETVEEGIEIFKTLDEPSPELAKLELELRQESLEAQKACKENPDDVETWKNWAMSLIHLGGFLQDKELDKEMLYEAKKKLELAVEIDSADLNAKWSLGEVYMYLIRADSSILETDYLHTRYCAKADKCFNDVRASEPEFCMGSVGRVLAQQRLENLGFY